VQSPKQIKRAIQQCNPLPGRGSEEVSMIDGNVAFKVTWVEVALPLDDSRHGHPPAPDPGGLG